MPLLTKAAELKSCYQGKILQYAPGRVLSTKTGGVCLVAYLVAQIN